MPKPHGKKMRGGPLLYKCIFGKKTIARVSAVTAILAHLGSILGHLGSILGHRGTILDHVDSILSHLGSIWGHLGSIVGCMFGRLFNNSILQFSNSPSLRTSKPPSLQWPRRDARSVNNYYNTILQYCYINILVYYYITMLL